MNICAYCGCEFSHGGYNSENNRHVCSLRCHQQYSFGLTNLNQSTQKMDFSGFNNFFNILALLLCWQFYNNGCSVYKEKQVDAMLVPESETFMCTLNFDDGASKYMMHFQRGWEKVHVKHISGTSNDEIDTWFEIKRYDGLIYVTDEYWDDQKERNILINRVTKNIKIYGGWKGNTKRIASGTCNQVEFEI